MLDLPHLYCIFGTTDGKLVPRVELNRTLTLECGRPLILTERAVDDAVARADLYRDPRELMELREFRQIRAWMIEGHFKQAARHAIQKLEEREEWAKFGMGR